jgi:hypothetical protein
VLKKTDDDEKYVEAVEMSEMKKTVEVAKTPAKLNTSNTKKKRKWFKFWEKS